MINVISRNPGDFSTEPLGSAEHTLGIAGVERVTDRPPKK